MQRSTGKGDPVPALGVADPALDRGVADPPLFRNVAVPDLVFEVGVIEPDLGETSPGSLVFWVPFLRAFLTIRSSSSSSSSSEGSGVIG